MGQQVFRQMFASPRALYVSAGILAIMGSVPGMPHLAFLSLASLAGGLGWWISQRAQKRQAQSAAQEREASRKPEPTPEESRELRNNFV